jgi:PTH1 family peptidyl-tRNA hydrolase
MLLIVGLGNPEPRYARNRHNIGFDVAAQLAQRLGADPWRAKFHGELARSPHAELLLVRPMTFMNDSGRSVQAVCSFFRIEARDVVVVHDELDLPFGTLRLKTGGGHAGHNGLRSIMQHLGTGDFARLRFGIGRPPPGFQGDVADFVLSDFSSDQRAALPDLLTRAVNALLIVARRGVPAATQTLNTRPKPPRPPPPATPAAPDLVAPRGDCLHEGVAKEPDSS